MRATLHITAGRYQGRKIVLRDGEVAQFGRTEWADFSFPGDADMADVHFRLDCSGRQCLLHDLQTPAGTWVDGQQIEQAILQTGNLITAGQTSFAVVLGDDAWPIAITETAPAAENGDASPPSPLRQCALEAKISDEGLALLDDAQSADEFVGLLIGNQRHDDALAMLIALLPRPQAIAWLCGALRSLAKESEQPLSRADERALAQAEAWAADPSDEAGREADAAAAALDHRTPAAWLALAAYGSSSNIAPPTGPPVAPPPTLGATALSTALTLLLAGLDPPRAAAGRARLCQLGKERLTNVDL